MDTISPKKRSENMKRIKSKNTKPELFVRKMLFKMGYISRINWKNCLVIQIQFFPAKKSNLCSWVFLASA